MTNDTVASSPPERAHGSTANGSLNREGVRSSWRGNVVANRGILGAVALVMAVLPLLFYVTEDSPSGVLLALAAVPLSVAGAIVGWIVVWHSPPNQRFSAIIAGVMGLLSTPLLVILLNANDYGGRRGRRLIRRGRPRLPPATDGADRAGWVLDAADLSGVPRLAAAGWRLNAATEVASTAAFTHLANELLALGAPAALVDCAQRNAVDEVHHARLCYGIARAIDGQDLGPAPFPEAILPRDRRLTVKGLAVDCILESFLFEAASGEVAAKVASRVDGLPVVRDALELIARDEIRHAQHGWEVVRWCLSVGDASILPALRSAVARVDPDAARSAVAADGGLEAFGLAGPETWQEAVRTAKSATLAALAELERAAA